MPSCAFDIDGFSRQPGVSELCCWLPAPLVLIQIFPPLFRFPAQAHFCPTPPPHTHSHTVTVPLRQDGWVSRSLRAGFAPDPAVLTVPILGVLVVETESEPEIIRQGKTIYDGATQSV